MHWRCRGRNTALGSALEIRTAALCAHAPSPPPARGEERDVADGDLDGPEAGDTARLLARAAQLQLHLDERQVDGPAGGRGRDRGRVFVGRFLQGSHLLSLEFVRLLNAGLRAQPRNNRVPYATVHVAAQKSALCPKPAGQKSVHTKLLVGTSRVGF